MKRQESKDPISGNIGFIKYVGKWMFDDITNILHISWENEIDDEYKILEINPDENEII